MLKKIQNRTALFKHKTSIEYLIIGSIFGALFPIFAWGYELHSSKLTLSNESFAFIIQHNPLILMISTAPLFLGIFAYGAGINQARVQQEKEHLTKIKELLSIDLEETNKKLIEEIAKRNRMQKRIKHMAYHDCLTGLPNKQQFDEKLEYSIQNAKSSNSIFAIMFIDLDNFKTVNDTLGHCVGDELLKDVSSRLKCALRKSDIISRIGGDEYVVIIRDLNDIGNITAIANKICSSLNEIFLINGNEVSISASIGISIFPYDGKYGNTLIENADAAMYRAKENGKNKYELYSDPQSYPNIA